MRKGIPFGKTSFYLCLYWSLCDNKQAISGETVLTISGITRRVVLGRSAGYTQLLILLGFCWPFAAKTNTYQ